MRLLWSACALLALLLALKFFVADVYRIGSESMRPTLFGGSSRDESQVFSEWVLVRYGNHRVPQRFELVVVNREAQDPIVKRVLGLPGESIRVVDGDVFINGKRLGPEAQRPAPVVVFDSALHSVSDAEGFGFSIEESPKGPWREQAGVWHLEAADIALGRDTGRSTGLMFYNPDVRDGYIDQKGKRIAGFHSVNDVIIECELALDLLDNRLRLQLSEAGDLFEARIRNNDKAGAAHVIELIRSRVGSTAGTGSQRVESVELSLELDLPLGEWLPIRFSNIDNCVTFECEKLNVKQVFCYDANVRFPGKPAVGDQNVGARAVLGGEGIEARFRSIKILRDLHYTSLPKTEVSSAPGAVEREEDLLFLGPDQIFLLGDNSSQSIDSRSYGPASSAAVLGRPVAVVWPLGRARWLKNRF